MEAEWPEPGDEDSESDGSIPETEEVDEEQVDEEEVPSEEVEEVSPETLALLDDVPRPNPNPKT